jgi:hypothetical protein
MRLPIVILSAWVLWQGIESQGQLLWQHRRTFIEPGEVGITAEQWCEGMRQQLTGYGTFRCLPEGTTPGEVRQRQQRPRP